MVEIAVASRLVVIDVHVLKLDILLARRVGNARVGIVEGALSFYGPFVLHGQRCPVLRGEPSDRDPADLEAFVWDTAAQGNSSVDSLRGVHLPGPSGADQTRQAPQGGQTLTRARTGALHSCDDRAVGMGQISEALVDRLRREEFLDAVSA